MFPQPPRPALPPLPALSRCRAPLLCVHVATAAANNKNQNQMLNKSNKLPSKWGKMFSQNSTYCVKSRKTFD